MGLRGIGATQLVEARRKAAKGKHKRDPWDDLTLPRLDRVLAFVTSMPITKGIREGNTLCLLPDQFQFLKAIYDAPDDERVRLAIKSAPRGNGKTGLAAPLALCHLLGPEAEPRGEIYSAAIDRPQAALMFAEMEAIIYAVPKFAARVNIQRFHKRIEVIEGPGKGSIYEALSADARRAHGLSPTLWIYDELAQAKDRRLLDNLQTAMGKRVRSLGIVISTQAPVDEHPLSQLIDDAIARSDPSIVVHLLAAPENADPFALETIRGVNPAIGKFLNEADIISEAERARNMPAFEGTFRNLRLNQRVYADTDERLCNAATWARGKSPVNRTALTGRPCYAGLDLSGKHDLTSLTLVFPSGPPDDPTFDILPFFWTPTDQLDRRAPQERDKFKTWIAGGHIITVPGPIIRFNFVAHELIKLSREFDIRAIAYDRYRMDDFVADLSAIDPNFPVPLDPFGQGYKSFTPAVETFIDFAAHGKLRHGGHPVLTACIVHAVLELDPAEGKKINKPKSRGRGPVRVDGAVTLCMALELAKRMGSKPPLDVLAMVA